MATFKYFAHFEGRGIILSHHLKSLPNQINLTILAFKYITHIENIYVTISHDYASLQN